MQAHEAKQQLAALQETYKAEAKDWGAKRAMLEKQQHLGFERAQRDKSRIATLKKVADGWREKADNFQVLHDQTRERWLT